MSHEHEIERPAPPPAPARDAAAPDISSDPPLPKPGGFGPVAIDTATLMALQRTAGNAAVARLVSGAPRGQPQGGRDSGKGESTSVELVAVVDGSSAALARSIGWVPSRPGESLDVHPFEPELTRATRSTAPGSDGAVSRPRSAVVMRYQAGAEGHGGIEQRALTAAGFRPAEARSVYVGNWLRDLSQLPKHPAIIFLIRCLSMGEFGRDTSAAELGTYVPSEHLDNPEGSGTVEDPEVRRDPIRLQAELDKLSPAQRAAYDREEANRAEITAAAKTSHLPGYVERGKFHAKEQLRQAVALGRTPEGMRTMGDGLHAVEDYYSHSNFVEACIFMLKSDPAMKPLVSRMAETHLGANPALLTPVDPVTGEVKIQTGTYAAGANDWVSRLELVQTEVENGELRQAFAAGWMMMAGITGEEIGRKLGEKAGGGVGAAVGAVGGGIGGAIGGGVSGALGGAAAGFTRGSGFFGTIGSTLGGLFEGGAEGAVTGAVTGATAGASAVGGLGAAVGADVGAFAGKSIGELIGMVGLEVILSVISVPFAAITAAAKAGLLEKIAEMEVNASGGEARAKGLSGPTHSELAKDAPEHKLFGVSIKLAEAADKEIGEAMLRAWAATAAVPSMDGASPGGAPSTPGAPAPAPAAPAPAPVGGGGGTATLAPPAPAATAAPAAGAEAESVTKLVDKYVCHPAHEDWWKPIVLAEAAALAGP